MRILLISETLVSGGAEWFVLRLTQYFQNSGHKVRLVVLRPDLIDRRLVRQFPKITLIHLPLRLFQVVFLIDRILNKFLDEFPISDQLNKRLIQKTIREFSPDILHSHLLKTDLLTARANHKVNIPHFTTIHGDYLQYLKKNRDAYMPVIKESLLPLTGMAVISKEQIDVLSYEFPGIASKMQKIYNGYPLPSALPASPKSRGYVHFGLIARGIPEKGWEPAIRAFLKMNHPNTRLMLFGEGAHLEQLKNIYTDSRIEFCGFSEKPLEAIRQFDIGLLPSYYSSESLPTTIIEYLALGKPVIATAVGEIPEMICADGNRWAGILIHEKSPEKMVEPLAEAMEKMMREQTYRHLAGNCAACFSQFSMRKCGERYLKLYETPKLALLKPEIY